MKIGEKIKQCRLQLGIDTDELANRIGKSRATVYRYENGDIENMPITILEPLAKILNTTPAYLMGWDEEHMKMPAMFNIGKKIKEERIKKGITLAQVAEKLGVTEATAQRYECGSIKNIPYEYIDTYGKILNCSPVYLMGWDENTMNKNYHIKLKVNNFIVESTMQAVSKHEAIGKVLEIVPTAAYKDIIEIKEDT